MRLRLRPLLEQLYDEAVVVALTERIEERVAAVPDRSSRTEIWRPEDILLIAYGDSIRGEREAPLRSLGHFLKEHVPGLISHIHLLPFFPYTSDDGFAVSDYRAVDPVHGSWSDVSALSQDFELVFDLVINHASSSHPHFEEFLSDQAPGNRYFYTANEETDVRGVTRPRAHPLLQRFETKAGPRWVWCTFSRDQVDWDFTNPDVLYEFIDVFLGYIERGASWMRMDAIAYLWKQLGTPCVHRSETHAVVQLFRVIAEAISSDIRLLTETNVPLKENLSYFGEGNEAHIVYNFPLPPILTHALVTGKGTRLTHWCQSLPTLPSGCTYLNFTASHDGIGLRPAEGILSADDLKDLLQCVERFGGCLTQRTRPDGSLSPYEANIALFDMLQGTVDGTDEWQVERFLVSQGVMVALAGVPALYYNTLLAAPNNLQGMADTGRNRTINRKKWTMTQIASRLSNEQDPSHSVLEGLKKLLHIRRQQAAFHPEAPQTCLDVDERVFVLKRGHPNEAHLLCLFNLSRETVVLNKTDLGLMNAQSFSACFIQGDVVDSGSTIHMSPYAMVWIQR